MRLMSLLLCLLTAACAADTAAPTPVDSEIPHVWQEGPDGWVYGPSPLYLSPASIDQAQTSVTIPDRIAFPHGSEDLDFNGRVIAVLQAQRASQLRHYKGVLVCNWTGREESELGLPAARDLAAERCQATVGVYRVLDSRIGVAVRLRRAPATLNDDLAAGAESFATLSLVPSGHGEQGLRRDHYGSVASLYDPSGGYVPGIYSEGLDGIFLPILLAFPTGSATLSTNARSLMTVIADVSRPVDENLILINCGQDEGEGGTAPADDGLARRRCKAVQDFFVEQGFCEDRAFFGENSTWINSKAVKRSHNVRFSIFASKTGALGKGC